MSAQERDKAQDAKNAKLRLKQQATEHLSMMKLNMNLPGLLQSGMAPGTPLSSMQQFSQQLLGVQPVPQSYAQVGQAQMSHMQMQGQSLGMQQMPALPIAGMQHPQYPAQNAPQVSHMHMHGQAPGMQQQVSQMQIMTSPP
eukprot:2294178-Karenia_brevis.AAC.1